MYSPGVQLVEREAELQRHRLQAVGQRSWSLATAAFRTPSPGRDRTSRRPPAAARSPRSAGRPAGRRTCPGFAEHAGHAGISFCPSCTSGFADCAWPLSLPGVEERSRRSTRWLLSTTELIGMRFSSLFRFGMTNGVSYVPMRPVSASRARNLIVYLPGSSVKPVSYSIGRFASSAAVAPLSLMSTLSRTFEIVRAVLVLDLADEIDQRALGAASPRQRQFAARNLHRDRHEVLGAVQLEVSRSPWRWSAR